MRLKAEEEKEAIFMAEEEAHIYEELDMEAEEEEWQLQN